MVFKLLSLFLYSGKKSREKTLCKSGHGEGGWDLEFLMKSLSYSLPANSPFTFYPGKVGNIESTLILSLDTIVDIFCKQAQDCFVSGCFWHQLHIICVHTMWFWQMKISRNKSLVVMHLFPIELFTQSVISSTTAPSIISFFQRVAPEPSKPLQFQSLKSFQLFDWFVASSEKI